MMYRIIFVTLLQITAATICSGQATKSAPKLKKNVVSFEIIDDRDTAAGTMVYFEWPFSEGQTNIGATKALEEKVSKLLADNGVSCPPKRQKVSDNVWLCGNGKKIRTNNSKLIDLFTEVWDEDE